jgi:hypothetical protein
LSNITDSRPNWSRRTRRTSLPVSSVTLMIREPSGRTAIATLGYHIAGAITEAVAFVAADDGHVAFLDDGAARLTDNRAVAFADLPAL